MAKMTIADLQTKVASYVAAAKQAGAWTATTDNKFKLIDKIGKIVRLDGSFIDKLPEFDGEELPLGKTIEEYFVDLIAPSDYDETGADNEAPAYPSVEDAAYSYTLGRKKFKTTVKYDDLERACNSEAEFTNRTTKILARLGDSENTWKFALKKQLLGNIFTKAKALKSTNSALYNSLVQSVALPVDTATGEAALKQIKVDVEAAGFASEQHSLNGQLIGAAPSLVLVIKKGVNPSLDVDTFAGAFHDERLAVPAKVIVVDDFGSIDDKVWGRLIDPRGVKLHTDYRAVRNHENADGDFRNYVLHDEFTGFLSKNTFVKIYTNGVIA